MRPIHSVVALALTAVSVQGCLHEGAQGAVLHARVAAVCHFPPVLVSARSDGRYSVDARVLDSAALGSTLHYVLSPRPEKIVMVDVDSTRRSSIPWIVNAIEANGGSAYVPDSACLAPSVLVERPRRL